MGTYSRHEVSAFKYKSSFALKIEKIFSLGNVHENIFKLKSILLRKRCKTKGVLWSGILVKEGSKQ